MSNFHKNMAARKPISKSKARPKPDIFQRITATLVRAEVGGVVLILLATVTLLSLLTHSNGIITGALINALETLFGVGVWGFPLVTGALGAWMVIRAIERLPDLPWQRPAGLAVIFLAAIIGATLWMQPIEAAAGGQVGLSLATGLQNSIGSWGAWTFFLLLALLGIVLLTDQLLPDAAIELWYKVQEWRQTQELRAPVFIEPVLPLPSGQLSWWKRWVDSWQPAPNAPPIQSSPNLVQPEPPLRRIEPQRPSQSTSPATQTAPSRAAQTTPLTNPSEPPMPRIIITIIKKQPPKSRNGATAPKPNATAPMASTTPPRQNTIICIIIPMPCFIVWLLYERVELLPPKVPLPGSLDVGDSTVLACGKAARPLLRENRRANACLRRRRASRSRLRYRGGVQM